MVWKPFARLAYHALLSHGSDAKGQQYQRCIQGTARLQAQHGTKTTVDDAYSPVYDRRVSYPLTATIDQMPPLRPNR